MNRDAEDLVCVSTGPMVEMELLKQDLLDAGIEARVMGEELAIGLGSALPGSVELHVFQRDALNPSR